MTVVGFVVAVISILGSVSAHEPISWGVAVLLVSLCFRWFWKLAKVRNENK